MSLNFCVDKIVVDILYSNLAIEVAKGGVFGC